MIVFAQTENIIVKQNMPIYDKDKYKYANKNSFTITLGKNLENLYGINKNVSILIY